MVSTSKALRVSVDQDRLCFLVDVNATSTGALCSKLVDHIVLIELSVFKFVKHVCVVSAIGPASYD